jgi:hypothetical protein
MSGVVANNLSGFIMHPEVLYETGIMATGDQTDEISRSLRRMAR